MDKNKEFWFTDDTGKDHKISNWKLDKGWYHSRETIKHQTPKWSISRLFDPWNKNDYGSCYFPKAEWFMSHFPRLSVRVFWVLIKLKKLISENS